MAAIINPAILLQDSDISKMANVNNASYFMSFNSDVDDFAYTIIGVGSANNDANAKYAGNRSLVMQSGDDSNDITVNAGTLTRYTGTYSANFLQFWILNPFDGVTSGELVRLVIARDGLADWMRISVQAEQLLGVTDKWVGFYVDMGSLVGHYFDFSWVIPANANYPTGGAHKVRFDGFVIEAKDRVITKPTKYTEPYRPTLRKIQSLTFASTAAGAENVQTLTLVGATLGKPVSLGLPTAAISPMVSYYAYVSAADTVSVVRQNLSSSTAAAVTANFTAKITP